MSPADRRSIEIYAAVFRRLVLRDHTFGGGKSPFDRVYILDGVVVNGASSRKMWKIAEPFSTGVRRGLLAEFRGLPPVTFISGAEARRIGEKRLDASDGKLRVILSVGRIEGDGSRVEVSNSLLCGGLCGQWMTYVLESADGRWRITGTTGPMAIS